MSHSKIFSGDLPELIYEVIKYFQNDYSTLYSCILVNRLWCRLAIPLLWENPFSFRTENYNFIGIYLHNLNDDLKIKLNECKIINNSLPSNTLFNYPSYLKYLNIYYFIYNVEMWFIKLENSRSYLVSDFKELIDISLFKVFIENEVNLHTLVIEITSIYYSKRLYNILELISQNTNFIHNIRNLKLHINKRDNENMIIKVLQVVNSHQHHKKFFIESDYFSFYQSLLLSKDYNCSNTLNTIIFYFVNFKDIINLKDIFEQLNALESIHIFYCSSLNTKFTQQIINLTKPFKLKSLFLNGNSQIDESLLLLLQKSGDYLENLDFNPDYGQSLILRQQFLELFIKYCKNIKLLYFYFSNFDNRIIYLTLNLIENIKNLNYLLINTDENSQLIDNIERSSIILQNLGQALPSKMEYLCLFLCIKASDLEVFLRNSQNTFIKKLVIYNYIEYSDDNNILPFIKKYIMNEKRVEYLAIIDNFLKKDPRYIVESGDLSHLKNEVEEFKLHDIKVRCYNKLLNSSYWFIKDID
ncbi:hypothetical protein RhiirB3_453682 [Rhizophagus irregularis]|nr:hypothetical protein RhiirB3_453682 [Rhizophagus irregularis]